MIEKILFYLFAIALISASSSVILVKNPVKAALSLILAFFASAGLWLLLEAQFLAISLVLIYVGAVMVLFLFVVMMLDVKSPSEKFPRHLPLGIMVGVLLVWGLSKGFNQDKFLVPFKAFADTSDAKTLGLILYSNYLVAFELAGIILLAAIVAAISLTFRGRRRRQMVSPDDQVTVNKEQRIRLIHDNTL